MKGRVASPGFISKPFFLSQIFHAVVRSTAGIYYGPKRVNQLDQRFTDDDSGSKRRRRSTFVLEMAFTDYAWIAVRPHLLQKPSVYSSLQDDEIFHLQGYRVDANMPILTLERVLYLATSSC